jgi:CRISPR system Cascade subunit CasD
MPEFLTFQLYGPMQSWGEIAVGGYRSSATYPSKSAVLGLIAAALGIERSEETMIQTLHESLKMAVCVFSEGQMMRDFHTLQEPPKGIYSSRQQEGQAITNRRFTPKA